MSVPASATVVVLLVSVVLCVSSSVLAANIRGTGRYTTDANGLIHPLRFDKRPPKERPIKKCSGWRKERNCKRYGQNHVECQLCEYNYDEDEYCYLPICASNANPDKYYQDTGFLPCRPSSITGCPDCSKNKASDRYCERKKKDGKCEPKEFGVLTLFRSCAKSCRGCAPSTPPTTPPSTVTTKPPSTVTTKPPSTVTTKPPSTGKTTPPITGTTTPRTATATPQTGWAPGAWGPCSKACGGGTQTRSVTQCRLPSHSSRLPGFIFKATAATVAAACSQTKPSGTQACNTQACPQPPSWVTGSWGGCSKSCGGGTQSRSVQCKRGNSPASGCGGGQPASSQSCNTHACPPTCTNQPALTNPKYKGSWFHKSVSANKACQLLGYKDSYGSGRQVQRRVMSKRDKNYYKNGVHKKYKKKGCGGRCYRDLPQTVITKLWCRRCS